MNNSEGIIYHHSNKMYSVKNKRSTRTLICLNGAFSVQKNNKILIVKNIEIIQ